ncbi:MAG: glycosyltransferase family 4 protein [Algisphaera sp.]
MKILQCHNVYQQVGGEDSVVADERRMLESHGHTVVQYTRHNDEVEKLSKLRLAAGTVWSRRTVREITELIARESPDIAHFHNTLPLMSPAVYSAAHRAGIPTVQTLHNYRFLCPKATFFRDDQLCEKCLPKRVKWPAIQHACYRDDRLASATVTAMLTIHGMRGTYHRDVDAYIACSPFTRDKMIEGGLPADRIHYKPNFEPSIPQVGRGDGGYALYLGRLSPEKGVTVLVDTWRRLPGRRLEVIGRGPQQDLVDALAAERPNDVVRHHWVDDDELNRLLSGAALLVLPSMNYEGFPKVIVESFARGLPVVASNVGAMAAVIRDGENGRLARFGDAEDFARVIAQTLDDPAGLAQMRINARRDFEENYTADINHDLLMQVYDAAAQRFAQTRGKTFTPQYTASSTNAPPSLTANS